MAIVRIVFNTGEPNETQDSNFITGFPSNLESTSWTQFFDTPAAGQTTIEHVFNDQETAQNYATFVQSQLPSSIVWVV